MSSRAAHFTKEMSGDAYNVAIGLVLLWGFALSAILCKIAGAWFGTWNKIALVVVYIVMVIAGVYISQKSKNPIKSFLGYNLVVVPMAAVLSILLSGVPNLSILNAAAITAVVAFVMIVAAIAFPKVFLTTGRILGTILIAVIIIELLIWIFGWYHPSFLDWLVALIFCGFIGYNVVYRVS